MPQPLVLPTPETRYPTPEAALAAIATLPPNALFHASARIRIDDPRQPAFLRVALMVRKPASLRVESIPLWGPPDFFLSLTDNELRVFLPREEGGRYYIGGATAEHLARFFPLRLPPTDIVSLLLGEIPPPNEPRSSTLHGALDEGFYRVDQDEKGVRWRSLWIDPTRHLLVRLKRFGPQGEVLYDAEFQDHLNLNGMLLPQQMTLRAFDALSAITLRYLDLRWSAAESAAFALPIPAGVAPLPLD